MPKPFNFIKPDTNLVYYDVDSAKTTFLKVPTGTTAQRPSSALPGMIRYNTTINAFEYYVTDWVQLTGLGITSVSPTSYNGANTSTFTITGSGFVAGTSVKFITNTGTAYTAATVTINNLTSITATTPRAFTVSEEPLDVQVVSPFGVTATLQDVIDCGGSPTWSTAAGSLGDVIEDKAMTNITLSATDPEGQTVSYSLSSGALPTGISLSSAGVISGTPNVNDSYVSLGVTYNFSIDASDAVGNSTSRSFSIIKKWSDGSTAAQAATSAATIYSSYGITTNGLYYITINGTARQVWCDMVNGGWMLAAKIHTPSDSTWAYASTYWTDSSVLNATSAPSDAVNIKTYAWFAALTQARFCWGTTSNFVTENNSAWTQADGTGLNGVFSVARLDRTDNANTLRNSNITRANWISLFNGAGIGTYANSGAGVSWDNCNYGGVNVGANNGNNYCRFGMHLNNEAECVSCDYHFGFGWAGTGGGNNPGNVGTIARDGYNGSSYRVQYPIGWIFVK